ncbi:MAG: glutamine--fructose-6-phosphate transaminase (isomerizing) [Bdellovibrionaceae bacterium]|nr:glutamine--fructose-6-phosphate transaminase (isomerizing) [Pseudobdellovibrionaceae bacterium]
MCGIVGYIGSGDPKKVILEGLKTLEYRGYDSAGVAILDGNKFKRIRAEGKLSILKEKLESEIFSGHIGIGHTRWATHGKPSERNAHPHSVKGVSIVHNGIIENYADLKESLKDLGTEFLSDTDSELVAHLISAEIDSGKDLFTSVLAILPRLSGAFSILAVSTDQPDEMVAFKNGPPLILGPAKDEIIVASDVQAIIKYTKDVIYLDDFEIAHIVGSKYKIFDKEGKIIAKKIVHIDWSPEQVEKQGYRHFMLKEIFEQPRAVAAAIAPHVDLNHHTVQLSRLGLGGTGVEDLESLNLIKDYQNTVEKLKNVNRIFIVACGTSYYAAMVGKYVIERMAGVPVEVDIASEFRYRNVVIPKDSLFVTISQSGETADTLAALRLVKEMGVPCLSICNVKRSTIDREAHGHLYMNAGAEIGVASTKAFVCTLSLLNILALNIGKIKETISSSEEQKWVREMLSVPSQMEIVLAFDKFFAEASHTLKKFRGFLYMGRGVNYPIALEGALKLKELAYMHAEGYASGEMKHGPLALIDESMCIVMLAPSDELYEKTVSNLEEAKARGGEIISIGTGENTKLRQISEHYLPLPSAAWFVNPILEVIPLQLLAYHMADALGHDVDQPRNLAKSVTVE